MDPIDLKLSRSEAFALQEFLKIALGEPGSVARNMACEFWSDNEILAAESVIDTLQQKLYGE